MNASRIRVRRVTEYPGDSEKIIVDLKVDGVWLEVLREYVDGPPKFETDLIFNRASGNQS